MSFREKKPLKSANNHIRIIAGQWRRQRLSVINRDGLRPTGDRMREMLFNWLMPYGPFQTVLDAFAGTGALGFEALSRGAQHAIFLEQQADVYQQLKSNCHQLKASATVHHTNALAWLSKQNQAFDLVFLDPPFSQELWQDTVQILEDRALLSKDAIIYVETPKSVEVQLPSRWQQIKHKQMGNTIARLFLASA